MEQLARGTPGFTGAELYNLVNQAAVKASKDGLKAIGMSALEYAKDKIMMGAGIESCTLSWMLLIYPCHGPASLLSRCSQLSSSHFLFPLIITHVPIRA